MIHSLRFRLLLAFTLVILVAVGAVFFFVSQTAIGEIRRFGERSEQARFGRVGFELMHHYREYGSWDGEGDEDLEGLHHRGVAHLYAVEGLLPCMLLAGAGVQWRTLLLRWERVGRDLPSGGLFLDGLLTLQLIGPPWFRTPSTDLTFPSPFALAEKGSVLLGRELPLPPHYIPKPDQ